MTPPHPVVAEFLAVLAESAGDATPAGLCRACVAVLPVARAAIVVHADSDGWELLCASDEIAARVEAVQATVGDGPAVDAIAGGAPVLVPDLTTTGSSRWPALLDALGRDAPSAVFAFPLQLGAIRLGVLDLYREAPQRLSSQDITSMTLVAHLVTMTLLNEAGRDGDPGWELSPDAQAIHQATGMVVAQLGVPAREAYVRLQGHAFAHGLLLSEVAADVVARRLRLSPNGHDTR
ncbi:GAF and ANTAR domain-containing protein [Nocardia sp. BMG111209]|uniref:GAF and ANTAR domain-containing protein n=1 Tax=Nocardia sp. BMG111209 TaxID=1160137 RepID=UPI00038117EF|nr:GAF and ANTAR domain-containing protein [Nocardia sp. BMG111209]